MDGAISDHLDATMRKVHEKGPVPEIDFTLHTMEDGSQVSTQERVCKGMQQRPTRLNLADDFL